MCERCAILEAELKQVKADRDEFFREMILLENRLSFREQEKDAKKHFVKLDCC
jgi:hypothetical protein